MSPAMIQDVLDGFLNPKNRMDVAPMLLASVPDAAYEEVAVLYVGTKTGEVKAKGKVLMPEG